VRVSSWEQSEGLGNLSECSARLDTAELVRYVKGAAVTREHVALRVGVAFVGQRYELADIGKHGCLPAPRPSAILRRLSSCSKSGGYRQSRLSPFFAPSCRNSGRGLSPNQRCASHSRVRRCGGPVPMCWCQWQLRASATQREERS